MCKLFAISDMSKVKLTSRLVSVVRDMVCKDFGHQDGFGYAVLSKDGSIGGERTIRPMNFMPLVSNPERKKTYGLSFVLKSVNVFGKIDRVTPKSFIAHGRLSTNNIGLENTHPFTNEEVALIHNGVVSDFTDKIKNLKTNCDSEILLRYWEMGGVREIEENVCGYYAMAVLDTKGKLHVVRDDKAMLYISWCRTIESYIIATKPEIILGVAKEMRWKVELPEEILDNTYAVFDGNEIVHTSDIKPLKISKTVNAASAAKALGLAGWDDEDENYLDLDPEEEPEPSYREAIDKDDYYNRILSEESDEDDVTPVDSFIEKFGS